MAVFSPGQTAFSLSFGIPSIPLKVEILASWLNVHPVFHHQEPSHTTMLSTHHRAKVISQNAQNRVDELVRKYSTPQAPSPVLLEMLNQPENYSILVGALRRQTALARCRSQEFEDCQVTVYDKALLALSNYGESPADLGALELYLTEFLGVVPISPVADGKEIAAKHVNLQNVLHRCRFFLLLEKTRLIPSVQSQEREPSQAPSKKIKREREDTSSPFDIEEYERKYSEPRLYKEEDKHTRPTTAFSRKARAQGPSPDVRVARLLEVYNQAKEDYFASKKRDGFEDLSAIRFLRDSAENTLRYLHANGMSDNIYVPDVEHTFTVARDKTAQILGGRNRHFDEDPPRRRRFRRPGASQKRARRVIDSYRPQDGKH